MHKEAILASHQRIQPFIHRTPVLSSRGINEIVGAKLLFKCENFQKMGAFKMRGAINAIQNLTSKQKENGVVTHSSGNFAQAISLASKYLNTKPLFSAINLKFNKITFTTADKIILALDSELVFREFEVTKHHVYH